MLIKCRECGKEASDEARTCPHCGISVPHPGQCFIFSVIMLAQNAHRISSIVSATATTSLFISFFEALSDLLLRRFCSRSVFSITNKLTTTIAATIPQKRYPGVIDVKKVRFDPDLGDSFDAACDGSGFTYLR